RAVERQVRQRHDEEPLAKRIRAAVAAAGRRPAGQDGLPGPPESLAERAAAGLPARPVFVQPRAGPGHLQQPPRPGTARPRADVRPADLGLSLPGTVAATISR